MIITSVNEFLISNQVLYYLTSVNPPFTHVTTIIYAHLRVNGIQQVYIPLIAVVRSDTKSFLRLLNVKPIFTQTTQHVRVNFSVEHLFIYLLVDSSLKSHAQASNIKLHLIFISNNKYLKKQPNSQIWNPF